MSWYVNPDFKGQGIIPPLHERLDDLVQAGNKPVLQNVLRRTLAMMGHKSAEIEEWIAKDEPAETLAHHCALFLKMLGYRDDVAKIEQLIAECSKE